MNLNDYEDIYTAIAETIKIPLTDGVTLARIKRDVNIIYLNEVCTFKPRAWWWLEKKMDVVTYAKFNTGTVAVTKDSATITFSSAPTESLTGYYIKLTGYPDIVKISAHTASATTATLEYAWVNDAQPAGAFKCWRDFAPLASDIKEVTIVTHDQRSTPIEALSNPQFIERRARIPEIEGLPIYYNTGDFDANGNRVLRWFPACREERLYLHISGVQEATALSADADEPLMPVEDRIVLYYGALSLAWTRERNESEALKCWQMFLNKLAQMAGKSGDAPQLTEMSVDSDYLIRKRYRRHNRGGGRRFESN